MTREWGASGVGKLDAVELSPDTREQIKQILDTQSIKVADLDGFLNALADAIAFFKAQVKMREESRPAAVRRNLKRAHDAALKLNDALNKLDGNARQLLARVPEGDIHSLYENVGAAITALAKAQKLANEYPGQFGGNIPANHRIFLAADVADVIDSYLGIKPTTTKEGLFQAILEVVLEEATGREVKAVHALVRRTLSNNVKRKIPDGTVEYVPPPKAK